MPGGQHHREEHAEQREERADRKIDAARDDDYAETDAEDAVRADQSRGVLQIGRGEKLRIEDRDDYAERHQQNECAEFFLQTFPLRSSLLLLRCHFKVKLRPELEPLRLKLFTSRLCEKDWFSQRRGGKNEGGD